MKKDKFRKSMIILSIIVLCIAVTALYRVFFSTPLKSYFKNGGTQCTSSINDKKMTVKLVMLMI